MSFAADVPDGLAASHDAWIKAVEATDVDAYAALVCEDVVWLPPGDTSVVGREAFRDWLAPFFGGYRYDFAVHDVQFRVADDWALERGRFLSRMTPRSGGEPVEHGGRFILLWRRDEDGTWRIERYVDDT